MEYKTMSSLDSQRWQSVEDGYLRHSETMATIAHEREILRASGFLDPLDGFAALAAAVARIEFIDERKAATERNIPWLLQIFSCTLHDVAREYTGAAISHGLKHGSRTNPNGQRGYAIYRTFSIFRRVIWKR